MAIAGANSSASANWLRIFRREAPVSVLGPERRAVIWVQGCPFACRGCIVPESWPQQGGADVSVKDLAQWVLDQPDIEGITLSGGEPMEQASGLAALIDAVRAEADLGVVVYTGHRIETLTAKGSDEQFALLARTDLLIDGVYSEREHADLRWRGSANQRLLPLTDRYRAEVDSIVGERDRSAGMEFFIDERGAFGFAGVPAQPAFRPAFKSRLARRGLTPG